MEERTTVITCIVLSILFALVVSEIVTTQLFVKQYTSLGLVLERAKQNTIQAIFDAGNRSLESIWVAKATVEKASETIKAEEVPLSVVNQSFEVWLVVKPASQCWAYSSNAEKIDIYLEVNGRDVFDKTYSLPTACNSYEFKVATVNYTGVYGVKEIKVGVSASGHTTMLPNVLLINPDSAFTKLIVTVDLDTFKATAKTGT